MYRKVWFWILNVYVKFWFESFSYNMKISLLLEYGKTERNFFWSDRAVWITTKQQKAIIIVTDLSNCKRHRRNDVAVSAGISNGYDLSSTELGQETENGNDGSLNKSLAVTLRILKSVVVRQDIEEVINKKFDPSSMQDYSQSEIHVFMNTITQGVI